MTERIALIFGLTIFATVSSVAWAVAIANIYGPPEPVRSAKEICAAGFKDARASAFCIEIARQP